MAENSPEKEDFVFSEEEEHPLLRAVQFVCRFPHEDIHQGQIILEDETIFISPGAYIDLTANVSIGSYSMIGEGTRILTHDHFHTGRKPLLLVQIERGVEYKNKIIHSDVWLHNCIVLMQVTEIPKGCVIGAGSVLTKNPTGEYEIWAGNPAVKIGERIDDKEEVLCSALKS